MIAHHPTGTEFDIYHGIENFNGARKPRVTDFVVRTVDPNALKHLRSEERVHLHDEALFVALYYQGLIPPDGDWWPGAPPAPEQ